MIERTYLKLLHTPFLLCQRGWWNHDAASSPGLSQSFKPAWSMNTGTPTSLVSKSNQDMSWNSLRYGKGIQCWQFTDIQPSTFQTLWHYYLGSSNMEASWLQVQPAGIYSFILGQCVGEVHVYVAVLLGELIITDHHGKDNKLHFF